jgi:hypothetical protein
MENKIENPVLKRIMLIIGREGLSEKSFCQKIGVPYETLKTLIRRDSTPKVDFLLSIKMSFEHYSLDWLLAGKGKMLTDEREKEEAPTEAPIMGVRGMNLLLDRQDGLVRENELLKAELKIVKNENEALKKEVSDLKSNVDKRTDIHYSDIEETMSGVAEPEKEYE